MNVNNNNNQIKINCNVGNIKVNNPIIEQIGGHIITNGNKKKLNNNNLNF